MKPESAVLPGYEMIEDVEISLEAELGHKTFTIQQLLNLRVGTVLPLGRPTGENVDVYAGDFLLGSGEILIVDSTLAIRMADLRGEPSDKGPSA
jgi:flagellar motor switch protein FliN